MSVHVLPFIKSFFLIRKLVEPNFKITILFALDPLIESTTGSRSSFESACAITDSEFTILTGMYLWIGWNNLPPILNQKFFSFVSDSALHFDKDNHESVFRFRFHHNTPYKFDDAIEV